MKDSDLVFQHGHAETAENSLQDNAGNSDHAKIAHPSSIVTAPKPNRENDRQESDCRSD